MKVQKDVLSKASHRLVKICSNGSIKKSNTEKRKKNTQCEINMITYSLLLFSLRNFKGKHENKEKKSSKQWQKISYLLYCGKKRFQGIISVSSVSEKQSVFKRANF